MEIVPVEPIFVDVEVNFYDIITLRLKAMSGTLAWMGLSVNSS